MKKLKKNHVVLDGKKSVCGRPKRDVTHITSRDGFHCNPKGAGYDDTCKICRKEKSRG